MNTWDSNSECMVHYHAKADVARWIKAGALGEEYKNCKALFEYMVANHPDGFTTVRTWRSLGCKSSPSFHDCVSKLNLTPLAAIDIVLVRHGKVVCGIEICHTNPTSEAKIRLLKVLGLPRLIEIDATWASHQKRMLTRPFEYATLIEPSGSAPQEAHA